MTAAATGRATVVVGRTLLIGLAGALVASFVGVPAGWLSGAMVAVTVAALAGVQVQVPARLIDACFVVLGTMLGAGVTPQILVDVQAWPVSLAGLLLSVFLMVAAVFVFLVKVARWDRSTAFFAAIPGALPYVVAVASGTGADLRKVAVAQSIRIFLLVAAIPALVSSVEPVVSTAPAVAPPVALAVLFVGATAGGLLFAWLRVPAGLLTGALLVSGVAHGAGWIVGSLPVPIAVAVYIVLGAMIGIRFAGTSVGLIRRVLAPSVGAFLVATSVAALCALLVVAFVDQPATQVLVAFAPGGLNAMTALALALQLDSTFVAAHQFVRFIAIAILAPFASRLVLGRERPES